ncbi:MAG: DNA repair protein RadC [Ferrovibrio sp.]|jgi:DNA repair protein RadC|nr:DNA repair protein RadC [Ferrovibrio sp.]
MPKAAGPKPSTAADGLAEDAAKPHYHGHRERLRERFLASGGDGMPDYEILELLLFNAIPRRDVKPLAKALVDQFGSLGTLLSAEPERLRRAGCSETVIAMLKLTREAGLRLLKGEVMRKHVISSWQALLDYCHAAMQHDPVEQFRVIFLDRKNTVIGDEEQQRGTVDHTPVYPREVVRRALELQASAVILVHNHPSGDPTPSKADIEMTKQVREAARAVGITLHDHVIVGRHGHTSFRGKGLI